MSSRSDDVSPLYNGQLYACAHEKIPRTFAYSVGLLNFIILSSLVCVGVFEYASTLQTWSIERHGKSMHFGRNRARLGHYLAALYPSTRVQNSFKVVELARDMSSICTGKFKPELEFHTGTTALRLWYHLVAG